MQPRGAMVMLGPVAFRQDRRANRGRGEEEVGVDTLSVIVVAVLAVTFDGHTPAVCWGSRMAKRALPCVPLECGEGSEVRPIPNQVYDNILTGFGTPSERSGANAARP